MSDRLLNGAEVCARLHMDRQELRDRAKTDALLAECFKPGCSRPYWHESSVDTWLAARVVPKPKAARRAS